MAMPSEQVLMVDGDGEQIDVTKFMERLRREEPERILADDEVGLVVHVGGLNVYSLEPTDGGEYLAKPVTEISCPRFSTPILRKQIGPTVLSVTTDAVFVIRDGGILRKVRAENLEVGMVLASGEKVFR
jgi:hypothetical protein